VGRSASHAPWATCTRWSLCSQGACGARHTKFGQRCEPVNIGTDGTITKAGGQMVTAPPHTPWLAPAVPNGRLHVSTRLRGYWPGCPLATTVTAPPATSNSASGSPAGAVRSRPVSVAGLPAASPSPPASAPAGLPRPGGALVAPPQPARARSSSISPTPRTALQHRRPTTRRHPPFKTESPRPPSTIQKRRKTRISPRERKSRRC